MTQYELSRRYWDWAFENPDRNSPSHAAIYFFAMEHWNRLGQKSKFGFPTTMAMEAVGIRKYQTYIAYFNDLCEWGFFELIQKSQNQYSSNVISVISAMPISGKSLDKANIKHTAKQTQKQVESTGQSNHKSKGSIDKQITSKQTTIIEVEKTEPLLPFAEANHKSFLSRFFTANDGYENKQARDLMIRDYNLASDLELKEIAERFNDHLTKQGERHSTMKDWQQHLNSWMRVLGGDLLRKQIKPEPSKVNKAKPINLPSGSMHEYLYGGAEFVEQKYNVKLIWEQ